MLVFDRIQRKYVKYENGTWVLTPSVSEATDNPHIVSDYDFVNKDSLEEMVTVLFRKYGCISLKAESSDAFEKEMLQQRLDLAERLLSISFITTTNGDLF